MYNNLIFTSQRKLGFGFRYQIFSLSKLSSSNNFLKIWLETFLFTAVRQSGATANTDTVSWEEPFQTTLLISKFQSWMKLFKTLRLNVFPIKLKFVLERTDLGLINWFSHDSRKYKVYQVHKKTRQEVLMRRTDILTKW